MIVMIKVGIKRGRVDSVGEKTELEKKKKKKKNLAREFYTLYEQKFSNMRPLLCITFEISLQ